MMTVTVTLAAILLSLAGIVLLTATDPKRRRVFGLPDAKHRPAVLACLLILAPGVALLIAGQSAAFVMWLAAVPLAGWALAAIPPGALGRKR
ncbi:hypothetical protein P24_01215 [Oceanibaculum indicum P24]|uniref:Uncharacterized protein n=1 Tax=Oceanibaculum indicum P24 TaxID=1207063 RepID=K2JTX0_9PROT|nr:hypothetical protein P24_01215 [Oceanibaculum indicum P24]